VTRIINICRGWGCDLSPHCERARYIPEAERDTCLVHEYIPTTPGEHCPDFESRKHKRWGEGPEPQD
jgi:hypothetical protein